MASKRLLIVTGIVVAAIAVTAYLQLRSPDSLVLTGIAGTLA